jgi:hypothetical protein
VVAGTSVDQQRNDFPRAVARPRKERGPADHTDVFVVTRIVGFRAGVEKQTRRRDVVRCGGNVQRGRVMPRLTRLHQRGIRAQEFANAVNITAPHCIEPSRREVAATTIDFGLQRAPTGKPVVLRDGEQRVGQLGARGGPPERG